MRQFTAASGQTWIATAHEEQTPRHHTRWFLVFQPQSDSETVFPLPEVRWQTLATAERTIATMSLFELRKRLALATARARAFK